MTKTRETIIISTENCFEGYVNGELYVDSYSNLLDQGCKDSDIEFSQSYWDDEKQYFAEFLKNEIKAFEKRYRTKVLEVALCGHLGLWNGRPIGGKISTIDNILEIPSVDTVEVIVNETREITIQCSHHDGAHCFGIYFITASTLKLLGYKSIYDYEGKTGLDYKFFESLYKNRSALKLPVNSQYFGVNKVAS